ncbi:hypothetical protein FJZ17_02760 [Candidatus Pacearchaeota archaeon]|nr:hypothetical protein [Candidatus Pacearchaeota archaeon]
MVEKKFGVLLSVILAFVLINSVLVSANLEIKKETVSSMAIKDLNWPATFNVKIKNLGPTDTFRIYSLVGIDLEPTENFTIAQGETKEIVLKAYPSLPVKVSPDYHSFVYKIVGQKSGINDDELAISIANLRDAFTFTVDNINPLSQKAIINFDNKAGHVYSSVKLDLSSSFFNLNKEFSLAAYEKKRFEVDLDKDKLRELVAGPYIVNAKIVIPELSTSTSTIVKFDEMPGIETQDSLEGWILVRREIEKINKGNVNTAVNVVITKDLFSSLFTSFNIPYTRKETQGFKATYIFEKEIGPGKSLDVVVRTNWWILIGIIVAIILIYYFADKYIRNKLVLKKKVTFVHTKGGEFALKVTLYAKARDFVEKIRIIDRLPPMVKLFERYGAVAPDRIDEKNRRIEWNINGLGRGEERVFSYIIYSKIGVMGRFELPPAGAIYEYEGKIKDASSNPAFFNNESKKPKIE